MILIHHHLRALVCISRGRIVPVAKRAADSREQYSTLAHDERCCKSDLNDCMSFSPMYRIGSTHFEFLTRQFQDRDSKRR